MKQIDNRQKQVIQSRAQRALTGFKNFFKNRKEHAHVPTEKHTPENSEGETEQTKQTAAPVINEYHPGPKVGRNDPCPCGSGIKYKKCCIGKPEIKPFSGARGASAASPPKAGKKAEPPSQKKAAQTTPRKKPRPK